LGPGGEDVVCREQLIRPNVDAALEWQITNFTRVVAGGGFSTHFRDAHTIPTGGGRFELSLDGELVYSKAETGQFPEESEMVDLVGKKLADD